MQAYIRIFILCIVSGTISSFIHKKQNKTNFNVYELVRTFAFYNIILYSILILVRRFSDKNTVIQLDAFSLEPLETYLLYFAASVVISAIMPVIIKKILRKKTDEYVFMSLSVLVGIYVVFRLLYGEITEGPQFCIIVGGAALALLITCFYKRDVQYFTFQNMKERLLKTCPVILFWIVLMVFYLPNELYLGNISDMEIPYENLLGALVLGSTIYFFILVALLTFFLTERQLTLVCRIIFAVTFAGYLQGILLNGKMNVMDGTVQRWSVMAVSFNILIWIIITVSIVFLPYIIKKNTDKIYRMICIYVSLILLVSWGFMRFTTDLSETKAHYELTTDGRMELSSKHNVIVFILDWFDWQIEDKILEQEPDFAEPLKDFTWYKNMTSLYAFTDMSIPYLLTDVEWKYDMEETEYRVCAYHDTSFLPDIAEQNYDIGIYTYNQYLSKKVENIVRNYSDMGVQRWKNADILERLTDCSRYKSYPFLFKDKYWYYADSSFFAKMRVENPMDFDPSNDKQFYNELVSERIHTSLDEKYEGAYRFYHLQGVHPPFEPDMHTKGKNCMNMVYEYLEQLKSAGVYDESTIIITADHGHNYLYGYDKALEGNDLERVSNPILFVKEANQVNPEGPVISMAPVSHAEMAATIIEAVGGDKEKYGDTFADIAEDSDRERVFIYRRHDDIPYRKYVIQGNARDWNNWHLE